MDGAVDVDIERVEGGEDGLNRWWVGLGELGQAGPDADRMSCVWSAACHNAAGKGR
ncbi:MAG: hypothetical protein M3Q75_05555 [Gemmatimonadota bacterium]|nr:hypothetical protein [Gemmatimonadota bacterium]